MVNEFPLSDFQHPNLMQSQTIISDSIKKSL